METECTLLHLKLLAKRPYPEPDQSSPRPHSTYWRSILILSSYLRLGLPIGLFPSGFPIIPHMHLQVSPPYPIYNFRFPHHTHIQLQVSPPYPIYTFRFPHHTPYTPSGFPTTPHMHLQVSPPYSIYTFRFPHHTPYTPLLFPIRLISLTPIFICTTVLLLETVLTYTSCLVEDNAKLWPDRNAVRIDVSL